MHRITSENYYLVGGRKHSVILSCDLADMVGFASDYDVQVWGQTRANRVEHNMRPRRNAEIVQGRDMTHTRGRSVLVCSREEMA